MNQGKLKYKNFDCNDKSTIAQNLSNAANTVISVEIYSFKIHPLIINNSWVNHLDKSKKEYQNKHKNVEGKKQTEMKQKTNIH